MRVERADDTGQVARLPNEGTAALDKALDVLDAIGLAPAGLSQAELAERLQLPRTTLYRLLATLVARGLVRRDPQRRVYGLGFRCVEYARAAYAMPDLVAAASMELRGLRDLTGETSYLAVLDGREVLSLERCDGAHAHRSSSALGQRKPLHCTSQGKAILSALPEAERDALLKDLPLPALTPRTLTERRRLLADLRLAATRGYALDDEEIVLGVRCVGAPVVDAQGQVRGAISVAGPAFRLTLERLELLGAEVAQAARRVGAQLASQAPARVAAEATDPAEQIRVVDGAWAFRGAFPAWDAAAGRLWWADSLAPALHVIEGWGTPQEADRVVASLDSPIDAMLLAGAGAAGDAGVMVSTLDGGWWQVQADGRVQALTALPRRRFSAACADDRGQLWACLVDGERWRVGPLGRAADGPGADLGSWCLPEPATALAWQADGSRLLALAPESGTIYALMPDDGAVRRLATIPKGSGRLAGLALETDGAAWCALKGGWSVARFAPDGSLDRIIGLPVPCPTGVALVGPLGAWQLCVPSAREGLSSEVLGNAPASGRVLALRLQPA